VVCAPYKGAQGVSGSRAVGLVEFFSIDAKQAHGLTLDREGIPVMD
jgi:hypothetical protein